MTVAELIAKLQQFPPTCRVFVEVDEQSLCDVAVVQRVSNFQPAVTPAEAFDDVWIGVWLDKQ